jgi:hypothetical protein
MSIRNYYDIAFQIVRYPSQCSCNATDHLQIPSNNGITAQTWLLVPDLGSSFTLLSSELYYFVVSVESYSGFNKLTTHESPVYALYPVPPTVAPAVAACVCPDNKESYLLTATLVPLIIAVVVLLIIVFILIVRLRAKNNEVSPKMYEPPTSQYYFNPPPPPVVVAPVVVAPPPKPKVDLDDDLVEEAGPSKKNPYESGFWDYHAQDRANLFLNGGESHTESNRASAKSLLLSPINPPTSTP